MFSVRGPEGWPRDWGIYTLMPLADWGYGAELPALSSCFGPRPEEFVRTGPSGRTCLCCGASMGEREKGGEGDEVRKQRVRQPSLESNVVDRAILDARIISIYTFLSPLSIVRYGVVANIIASHAIARGSIPRVGTSFSSLHTQRYPELPFV